MAAQAVPTPEQLRWADCELGVIGHKRILTLPEGRRFRKDRDPVFTRTRFRIRSAVLISPLYARDPGKNVFPGSSLCARRESQS